MANFQIGWLLRIHTLNVKLAREQSDFKPTVRYYSDPQRTNDRIFPFYEYEMFAFCGNIEKSQKLKCILRERKPN